MQIVLTLRTYLVSDLQNPHVKIPIWQDTTYMKHKFQEKQCSIKYMKSMLFTNKGLQVLSMTSSL